MARAERKKRCKSTQELTFNGPDGDDAKGLGDDDNDGAVWQGPKGRNDTNPPKRKSNGETVLLLGSNGLKAGSKK
jgi:hypothetical protein